MHSSNSKWTLIIQKPLHLAVVCVLLASVLLLPFLGHTRLIHEEPRRAIIAENMMITGDYLVPELIDQVYVAKPPLYNWLIMATSWSQGYVDEFSARISSFLTLLALTLIMIMGMRTRLQATGLSFLAFATLLSPQLINKGTLAEIESLFTFMVTMSLWTWFWNYERGYKGLKLWLVPGIIVALSFLTKREPAIVFYYFGIAGFLIYKRQFWTLFSPGHLISAAVTLGIIGAWLYAMIDRAGVEALLESSQKEVINRGLSESWLPLLKHMALYPFEILMAAFPFSLLIIPLLFANVRDRLYRRYGDIVVFAAIAVLINLPIYWFRTDAAVRYFMPMLPTALVLAALVFQLLVDDSDEEKESRVVSFAIWFGFSLCLILGVVPVLGVWVPAINEKLPPFLLSPWMVTGLSAVYIVALILYLRNLGQGFVVNLLPLFVLFIIGYRLVFFDILLPRLEAKLDEERNLPALVAKVNDVVLEKEFPIYFYGRTRRDIWFYMGRGNLETANKMGKELPDNYFIAFKDAAGDLTQKGVKWNELYRMRYREDELVFGKVLTDQ